MVRRADSASDVLALANVAAPGGRLLAEPSGSRSACAASSAPTVRDQPHAASLRLEPRSCAPRAGQTTIIDATIWTAVEECQAESATFDCPASQATYGPIEDWDVGAVTSLNNWGAGCTENADWKCGRASAICFDVA